MNKIIIALGVALVSATSAFADSSALDVVSQKFEVNASVVDYAATGSIGGVATSDALRFGDASPMHQAAGANVDNVATGSIATTDYVTNDRLGGNS